MRESLRVGPSPPWRASLPRSCHVGDDGLNFWLVRRPACHTSRLFLGSNAVPHFGAPGGTAAALFKEST